MRLTTISLILSLLPPPATPLVFGPLLAGIATSSALSADAVGVQKTSVVSQDYGRALALTIWYPSKGDGEKTTFGENRIFEGTSVHRNATIQDGRFPLILLSHGSGGRVEGMGWIAERLAEAGFIVAGPNHPGTTSGDSTPAATLKVWERTQDVSTIVAAFSTDHRWSGSIDPARIGILGFSLGGTTALELAGVRTDLNAYRRYCAESPEAMDCRWMLGNRGYADGEPVSAPFDLADIDKERFEQSNREDRIKAVVAVDPGLANAFQPESLKAIRTPTAFINLGSRGLIPSVVLSDGIATEVPGSSYAQVDDADHFSFLPVCKPGATEFLISVGEVDPICKETGRPRKDIHDELSSLITDAFTRMLRDMD